MKLPKEKFVYVIYTCALDNHKYGKDIEEIAAERGCTYLGKYSCKGYNTYGPWKIIGGMNKKHPNSHELKMAIDFYNKVMQEAEKKIKFG